MGTVLMADPFTGTDADLGASWETYSGIDSLQRVSDTAQATVINAAADNLESHSGTLPDDQWVEGVVGTMGVATEYNALSVGCRWAAPNTLSGYLLLLDVSAAAYRVGLYKVTAGAFVNVVAAVPVTLAGGDVFRIEARGTRISGWHNGVEILVAPNDPSFSSGRAAIEIYPTVSLANASWNSVTAGDFVLGPVGPLSQRRALLAQ